MTMTHYMAFTLASPNWISNSVTIRRPFGKQHTGFLRAERMGMSLDEVRVERPDTAVVPPELGRFAYENAGISEYKS